MRYTILILFIWSVCSVAAPLKAQDIDSLDIKIGQMILVGLSGTDIRQNTTLISDIKKGKVGGVVLYEKNISPKNTYHKLKKLTWSLQQQAPIPLFMSIDQEGGKVNRLKEKYGFPPSVTARYLGQVNSMDSVNFYYEMMCATLSGLGINVNFAPVVDLATNKNNPIIAKYGRAYSDNANIVTKLAAEAVRIHRDYGIVSVLKHFPGHGSSRSDTHLGMADVTPYWISDELIPYKKLIAQGQVDAIMTAHIVNKRLDESGLPGTLSRPIMTGLLRDELKHQGVIFSDDMQMHAISKHYGLEKAIRLSIDAGVDVLMFSNNIPGSKERTVAKVHSIIKKLVLTGALSRERIEISYRRILKLKKSFR